MPGLRSSTSTRRMPLPSSVDSRRSERSSRAVASSYSVSRAIDPEDPVVRIEVVLVPLLIEPLYGQAGAPCLSQPRAVRDGLLSRDAREEPPPAYRLRG